MTPDQIKKNVETLVEAKIEEFLTQLKNLSIENQIRLVDGFDVCLGHCEEDYLTLAVAQQIRKIGWKVELKCIEDYNRSSKKQIYISMPD
jgi:hypothetical protein